MKKLIMLSLIAVFAICSLVAMDYTVQVTSGSRNNVVDGYVMWWVGDASHPNGFYYSYGNGYQHIVVHGYTSDGTRLFNTFVVTSPHNGYYQLPVAGFEGVNWSDVAYIWVYHDGGYADPVVVQPYTGNHRVNFTYNDTNY